MAMNLERFPMCNQHIAAEDDDEFPRMQAWPKKESGQ